MAEQILPCPGCHSAELECDRTIGADLGHTWSVVCLDCGCAGPTQPNRLRSIARWNALPREADWIEVATAGLPEPSDAVWELWTSMGNWHIGSRRADEWCAWYAGYGIGFVDYHAHSRFGFVTHYRPHRAPKGPGQ